MFEQHRADDEAAEVLVIANRTADSDELLAALRNRCARGPARFALVVPATPHGLAWAADMTSGIPEARRQMRAAEARLRATGLPLRDVRLGSPDPLAAALDAVNFHRFDEVIVCTLPRRVSRWLRLCLPHRIGRVTGLPVQHVVAHRAASPAVGELAAA
jgi:hypothetical protein